MSVSVTTAAAAIPKRSKKVLKAPTVERKKRITPKKGDLLKLQGVSAELLAKHPITPFQSRVYALTQAIPVGFVTTYGAMAQVLHSSPRAVGQALRTNPFAPTVPWYVSLASHAL